MRVPSQPPESSRLVTLTDGYQLCGRCGRVLGAGDRVIATPRALFYFVFTHLPGSPECWSLKDGKRCKATNAPHGWKAIKRAERMHAAVDDHGDSTNVFTPRESLPVQIAGHTFPTVCTLDDPTIKRKLRNPDNKGIPVQRLARPDERDRKKSAPTRNIGAELKAVEVFASDEAPVGKDTVGKNTSLSGILEDYEPKDAAAGNWVTCERTHDDDTSFRTVRQLFTKNYVEEKLLRHLTAREYAENKVWGAGRKQHFRTENIKGKGRNTFSFAWQQIAMARSGLGDTNVST